MGNSVADINAAGVAAGAHLQLRPIACNTRLYSVPCGQLHMLYLACV